MDIIHEKHELLEMLEHCKLTLEGLKEAISQREDELQLLNEEIDEEGFAIYGIAWYGLKSEEH